MRGDFNVFWLVWLSDVDVVEHDNVWTAPLNLIVSQHLAKPHVEISCLLADIGLQGGHRSLLLLDLVTDSDA